MDQQLPQQPQLNPQPQQTNSAPYSQPQVWAGAPQPYQSVNGVPNQFLTPALPGQFAPVYYAPSGDQPGAPGNYLFNQLERTSSRSRWWYPLVTCSIFFAGALVTLFISTILATPFFSPAELIALQSGRIPATSLSLLVFSFVIIALLLIPLLLAQLFNGRAKYGQLVSVAGKIRWKWLFFTLAAAAGLYLIQLGISFAASGFTSARYFSIGEVAALIVFFLVIVPLQCAAEEFIFRGLIMQTVGRWVKYPIVAILVQTLLFIGAHGYGVWGALSVGLMGLVTGWLAIQTGGLEAGISLHVANNWGAMAVTLFAGETFDSTATGEPIELVVVSVVFAAYIGIIEPVRRRRQLANVYCIRVPRIAYVTLKQIPAYTPLAAISAPYGQLTVLPAPAASLEYLPRAGVLLPPSPAVASYPLQPDPLPAGPWAQQTIAAATPPLPTAGYPTAPFHDPGYPVYPPTPAAPQQFNPQDPQTFPGLNVPKETRGEPPYPPQESTRDE